MNKKLKIVTIGGGSSYTPEIIEGFIKRADELPIEEIVLVDIEELCPEAWLINFTNPSGMVTEAVLNNTKVKCIGLCNVPVGMMKAVEEVLGSDDFIFHAVGLNHYVWGKHIYFKGRDVVKEILPKLMLSEKFNPKNIDVTPWIPEQIEEIGMMPCPYHKYYYMRGDMLKKQLKDYEGHKTRAEFVKGVEDKLFELYKNEELKEKPKELENRGGAYYSEAACELISSIYNNKKSLMVVNVPNNGIIKSLSDDSVIETTAYITSSGAIPLSSSQLPLSAQGEVALLKTFEKLVIDAAINCDYGKALQALSINPLVEGGTKAKTALDMVIDQNKKYLKGW